MRKIPKENYWELAQFVMDYNSGGASRGYRILCRLRPGGNWTIDFAQEMRETEMYQYLEENYSDTV